MIVDPTANTAAHRRTSTRNGTRRHGFAVLITLIPGLSDVGMIFGLGSIVWFVWAGVN